MNNIQQLDALSRLNTRPGLFNIAQMLRFGQRYIEYPAYWIDRVLILCVLRDGEMEIHHFLGM